MKYIYLIITTLLVFLFYKNYMNNSKKPIQLYISINKNKCELVELGSGYKKNYLIYKGKIWEKNGQHYECSIKIPEKEFKNKLGSTCVLSGFNQAASYFYKDKKYLLRAQSCDFRQLKDGVFYFNAGGIDTDSCSWTCF